MLASKGVTRGTGFFERVLRKPSHPVPKRVPKSKTGYLLMLGVKRKTHLFVALIFCCNCV